MNMFIYRFSYSTASLTREAGARGPIFYNLFNSGAMHQLQSAGGRTRFWGKVITSYILRWKKYTRVDKKILHLKVDKRYCTMVKKCINIDAQITQVVERWFDLKEIEDTEGKQIWHKRMQNLYWKLYEYVWIETNKCANKYLWQIYLKIQTLCHTLVYNDAP